MKPKAVARLQLHRHDDSNFFGEHNCEQSAMHQYRRIKNGYDSGVLFGSYYSVNGAGTLNVGDSFEVNV